MSVSVCLSVCMCVCLSVHDHIFGTTRPIFTKFFVHVTYGLRSVHLWGIFSIKAVLVLGEHFVLGAFVPCVPTLVCGHYL